jgi:acyl-coenzyme A thioesterase PaaI-like protein
MDDPATTAREDAVTREDQQWSAHFVGALGIEMWSEDGITHGRAPLRPEMWAPGTDVVRLGVLATMVDMVVGSPPSGAINPTVDLRVTMLSRPPAEGTVYLACTPAKVGRRLFVGETTLHAGDPDRPFARSVATFMNQPIAGAGTMFGFRDGPPPTTPSFDEILNSRFRSPGVVEMDAHPKVSNGPAGTIQGGAQALLGEVAAEHALAPRGHFAAVDLDIRYLNRVRTEAVVATATVLPGELEHVTVRVPITGVGDGGRIVSLVSVACREP